ncbi:MAG TPA: 5-amino-6-(D-ribitylamino)uracil--L-tyrosine 4-hydroxyphenyl transferase CofH [Kineosporiaceae bacterium]|nr:5-amino-6-(D-ribitylamino)uracil--L-tyrosine 4-hydroxyphenyl transferase CofH [Kineosporiaceae bacterium]
MSLPPDPTTTADVARWLALPGDELHRLARQVRDGRTGTRITYSPKVFIPLTHLCRDRCGYCTFAQSPARAQEPYLSPEQVLAIAEQGAAAGCHEALFTLGEQPEDRYPQARDWLTAHGYSSTVEYLIAMCALVLTETGLLPHANAGALPRPELAALREVSIGQGMMLESLNPGLAAHRGAPDKSPQRRLDTLEAAGELAIPFTTGILVGIGETLADRIAALQAVAASHSRHGHVQEVIVQNFLPKPGTAMRDEPACPPAEHLQAIALARLILPPDVHVQAPPNLSDDFAALLDAGIDDWGGVSPVTADHVNPERPWPHLERLRTATESRGLALAPRLTIYPEFALDAGRWVDPDLHFCVLDRSDAHGLARDDPGSVLPERYREAVNVGTGAEVMLSARRSTAWYSGTDVAPTVLIPSAATDCGAADTEETNPGTTSSGATGSGTTSSGTTSSGTAGSGTTGSTAGRVAEVLAGIRAGQELGEAEVVALLSARGPEVAAVAALADELRAVVNGDAVTFVRNRNINYTNVCTFKCSFCGFSKGPLTLNLRGTPYLLTLQEIADRVREAAELGATEVCLQGGIHPSFDGDYYVEVARAAAAAVPGMHLHGFTALEVTEGARRLGEPLREYLLRLKEAGLRSLPGTAAEILDDEVRAVLCPDKISTQQWLDCHETAHAVGLRSNVTMMFGSIERPEHQARHLLRTRDLQRRTGGFTEFVGLPFVHMAAPIYLKRRSRRGPTWREVLLLHAVARIVYHGAIDHIQASWVKLGTQGIRQLLAAGVDDLGGTLMEENISRAAGAAHGQLIDESRLRGIAEAAGRTLSRRGTLYQLLDDTPVLVG